MQDFSIFKHIYFLNYYSIFDLLHFFSLLVTSNDMALYRKNTLLFKRVSCINCVKCCIVLVKRQKVLSMMKNLFKKIAEKIDNVLETCMEYHYHVSWTHSFTNIVCPYMYQVSCWSIDQTCLLAVAFWIVYTCVFISNMQQASIQ